MFQITAGGKVFTFMVLMIGLGIVAIPTGLIASALAQERKEIADENDKIKASVNDSLL